MAKKQAYFHVKEEKLQEIPVFISSGFWDSIGADTSRARADSYYFNLLKTKMSEPHVRTSDELRQIEEEDVLIQMWYKEYKGKKDNYLTNIDSVDIIVENYPAHLTTVARLYFKIFDIELFDIPNPHTNKNNFAYWCKDLEKIKIICGEYLSDCLIRANRNYKNRHDFKLDHPGTIFKILKSAKEEVEEERKMLFSHKESNSPTEKSSLTQMRKALG